MPIFFLNSQRQVFFSFFILLASFHSLAQKEKTASLPPPIYYDYGDAPSSYSTLDTEGGPSHSLISGMPLVKIGKEIDFETQGKPSEKGDGDDLDNTSDEDAVSPEDFFLLNKDSDYFEIEINYESEFEDTVHLFAWIDFDRSGSFEPDEFTSSMDLNPGKSSTKLIWSDLKERGVDIVEGYTFARFRITFFDLKPTDVGGDAPLGEVEDHYFKIGQSTLNTDEFVTDKIFELIPNPVESNLEIGTQKRIHKIEIYGLDGRKIKELSGHQTQIDFSNIPPSVYFLKIFHEDGFSVKRILKT